MKRVHGVERVCVCEFVRLCGIMYESIKTEETTLRFSRFNEGNVGQCYFLRTAFAFLASCGMFALVAAITSIKMGHATDAYIQGLSVLICWVAAYHYYEIVKIRHGETSVRSEMKADALRYGDWIITMPLLTLKLYAVINRPSSAYDRLFSSPEIAALASVLMVALGTFVRLGLDELSGWQRLAATPKVAGITAWALSCVCLILLLVDLARAGETHPDAAILRSFIFVWVAYPLVTFLAPVWRYMDKADTPYDTRLSIVKDASLSCLDVYAKGAFAWYSASKVFGVSVFAR